MTALNPNDSAYFDGVGTRGVPSDYNLTKENVSLLIQKGFDRNLIITPKVWTQPVKYGKSISFPVIGKASLSDVNTHVPGTDITAGAVPTRERIITIDALRYHALTFDNFEERLLHFPVRDSMAEEQGEILAAMIEQDVAAELALAAQTSGIIGGNQIQPDGTVVNDDTIETGATDADRGNAFIKAVFAVRREFRKKEVRGELSLIVTPDIYYFLQNSNLINSDLITNGGTAGLDTGVVPTVAGLKIYESNYLPVGTAIGGKNLHALIFNQKAVGVAKLQDVTTREDYLPKQFADLLASKYSYGYGVVNPSRAAVITGGTFV